VIHAGEMQVASSVAEARRLYEKASNHVDASPGTLAPLRTKGEIESRDVTGEFTNEILEPSSVLSLVSRLLLHQGACKSGFDNAVVRVHECTAT